ncbi:MAG TPA: radical SAM protein [Candidatus Omnitrophota bacterium]|nr:radical SAM protein [Candidatus Omnitrophota bacterium]
MTGTNFSVPNMVFADERGEIFNHPSLEMMGQEALSHFRMESGDWIPLPEGTKFFTMPGHFPAGWDASTGGKIVLREAEWEGKVRGIQAVSAFMSPGFTRTFLPAVERRDDAPVLPLWAYAAVGWKDGRFWTAGIRVDPKENWDARQYDDRVLLPRVKKRLAGSPDNRLLRHLERCALRYHCLAAKNLFLGRWECPLPVSPACNADCLGCLSLQPEDRFHASHERLDFVPRPDEILGIAVPHLERASEAVVSFGQGCEGEPLLQAELIAEAIRGIRRATRKGVIHLNTNGYSPSRIALLAEAGLDSVRISLNSARPEHYRRYGNPRGFDFPDVRESIRIAGENGVFTSINYLTFPGLTDTEEEIESFSALIRETKPDMIQWKNLNIDPFQYVSRMGFDAGTPKGMRRAIGEIRKRFPKIHFGYFNCSREIITALRGAACS